MHKSILLWDCLALISVVSFSLFSVGVVAQSQSGSTSSFKTKSETGNSVVSLSSSISVPISNETLKIKNGMLVSSVISFLNSGPNVLKTQNNDQTNVKTKISNKINNDTQNVEGAEATNAVIGIEIGKALKTIISTLNTPNQTAMVTIETSSTCSPGMPLISCENTMTIQ